MSALLVRITPNDPPTLFSATFLLAAVAALASHLPARRATRAGPILSLRYE